RASVTSPICRVVPEISKAEERLVRNTHHPEVHMSRTLIVAVVLGTGIWSPGLAGGPAGEQGAKSVIGQAAQAMGADGLNTLEFSATGQDFALGQAYNPSAPWPKFIEKSYTRVIDYRTPATRVDRIRLQGENPPHGGGLQPIRGEQPQTQTTIVSASTPWVQQLDIWMTPHGFLKAAAAGNATVNARTLNGKKYDVLSFTGRNKAQVNGYVNDRHVVERVETWIDNAMLGDMLFEAIYTEYKDFNGVMFPTRIVQKQGGYPIFDLTVSDVKPNA